MQINIELWKSNIFITIIIHGVQRCVSEVWEEARKVLQLEQKCEHEYEVLPGWMTRDGPS